MDQKISERIQCTEAEKYRCLEVIKSIMSFNNIARTQGLLELEKYSAEENSNMPFIFRKGLSLIIDGFDKTCIEGILERLIIAGNFKGFDLLLRVIIKDGLLLIQAGEHPLVIFNTLTAWLGEDFCSKIDTTDIRTTDEISNVFEAKKDKKVFELPSSPLAELQKRMETLLKEETLTDALDNCQSGDVAVFLRLLDFSDYDKLEILASLHDHQRILVTMVDISNISLKRVEDAVSAVENEVIKTYLYK